MSDLKSRKSFILIVFFLTSIVVRSQSLIIDTTFGDYGINFLGTQSASSVKMQSDGRILVLSQIGNQGFIHRFESSGTPDLTFGSSGTLAVASQIEVVFTSESIVLQPDGKILVLGTRYLNGPATFCVARYTSSGILDNSFGTNGIKVIDINPNFDEDAAALCLQNDGKILLQDQVVFHYQFQER